MYKTHFGIIYYYVKYWCYYKNQENCKTILIMKNECVHVQ